MENSQAELNDLFVQVLPIARELGVLALQRLGFEGARVRANNRRNGTRTPLATVDIASGLIVAVDVLNVVNEDAYLVPTVVEVQQQFGLASPPEVLTDGLNCTGANLAACAERGISMISPCDTPDPATNPALRPDPTQPAPTADWDRLPLHKVKVEGKPCTQLDKSAFVYDQPNDCYWCPLGQKMPKAGVSSERSGSGRRYRTRYQAPKEACAGCPLRARCLQGKAAARQISREQHEAHRERHAQKMATKEAQETYTLRRHPGERPFAGVKRRFGLRRFLLRGLDGVKNEWRWSTIAFNLHRLMTLLRTRAGPRAALPSTPP